MVDLKFHALSPFIVQTKIEQEFIDLLLEKGKESQKKNLPGWTGPFDHAGVVKEAHYYDNKEYGPWFIPKFSPYMDAYIKGVSDYCQRAFRWKKQPLNINLTSLWINYQQALEYNPPHNHDGDVSFVIYLQVPDEIKKENKEMQGVHNNLGPGVIHFDFPGVQLPFCGTTFSQLPEVGDLFMFPSWLTHHVSSFKTDVERISVSGNINFENKEDKIYQLKKNSVLALLYSVNTIEIKEKESLKKYQKRSFLKDWLHEN